MVAALAALAVQCNAVLALVLSPTPPHLTTTFRCIAAATPLPLPQVIAAVDDTVRVVDANEALPTSVFEGPILR